MRAAHLTRHRLLRTLTILTMLLVVSMAAAALLGPARLSLWSALTDPTSPDAAILFRARLPRVLMGAIVGGALGCAGAGLQGLLGNPLADPHLLGVSAGAAVAGVVALMLGTDPISPVIPLAAFLGALGTMAAVYSIARAQGRAAPHAILLVGIVCNALAAAAIMLVNAVVSYREAQGVLFWMMGALTAQSYALVLAVGIYALVGALALARYGQHLNLLAAGEDSALTLGVEVERVRALVFVAASLLVGAAVAVSGMINFVGLIVPHILRLILGPDHRLLLPASFLGGAIFLVWADTAARTALGPSELPVGVVTAFLGGPFFIYLLRRSLRRGTGA